MSSERGRRHVGVVVLGSSVSILVRPHREPGEATYAEWLGELLRTDTTTVAVVNEGRWFEMVDAMHTRWDSAVAPRLPDVVVLHVGFVECQPWVLPHRIHRWALDWKTSLHPGPRLVRRLVADRLVAVLRWWTPRATRGLRGHLSKRSPARFAAEVERLVRQTRRELGALVLVVSISPPGSWLPELMPDIGERVARYNRILRAVVTEQADPGVRLVDVAPVHRALGAAASTDGIHLSGAAHHDLAVLLAAEVEDWYESLP